jgi:hypothetical protein
VNALIEADVLKRDPASSTPGRLRLCMIRRFMVAFAWKGLLTPFWALVVWVAIHRHDQLLYWEVPLEGCRIADKYMRTDQCDWDQGPRKP